MNIIIIGGGAAGFFAAINAAELHPEANVVILEKSNKLLATSNDRILSVQCSIIISIASII